MIPVRFCFAIGLISLVSLSFVRADDNPSTPFPDHPDTIYLRTGGELKGKVVSESEDATDGRTYVIIRTESGGLVKLDMARLVRKIQYADAINADYQRRLKIAGDDPNLIWKIYDWCQDQEAGSYRFKDELQYLLKRIALLDANDERSRRLLGYDLIDGQWIMKPQVYAAHGYIKNGTSWSPALQSAVDEKFEAKSKLEGERKSQLRIWLRGARRSGANTAELSQQLFSFCDEMAVPIIFNQEAKDERNPDLRLIYVEAFGRVPSFAANQALCYFAIEDVDAAVRERALTLLDQPHFDHASSTKMLSGYLTGNDNLRIRRAAFAIGELHGVNAVMPLIEALETKHTIAIQGNEPGRMKMGFGNGGAGLQTGGGPQSRDEYVRNNEARVALKKITDQDLGFDKPTWKQWYLENYTLHDTRVRADD
jgi:hypothetical protein